MSNSSDSSNGDKPTGRVCIDDRGRAIWQPDPGVASDEAIDTLLSADLSLAETPIAPIGGPTQAEQGFDPYHSGVVRRSEPRSRPSDMRKLSEQILAARKKLGT